MAASAAQELNSSAAPAYDFKKNNAIFFTVAVTLFFCGCASHAPSAAQFMNVKEGGNAVVGGSFQGGDVYSGHYRLEEDYTAEETRGFFDLSLLFAVKNAVLGILFENLTPQGTIGYRGENLGLFGWFGAVSVASDKERPISGGLMLVEEIHVTDEFRVGFSEHVSRNGYGVDENGGGFGSPSTGFYAEIGGGAYLAYGGFSLEVKYGRDITSSMNRIYYLVNYGF